MNILKKKFKIINEDDIQKFKKEISDLNELLKTYREKEKLEKFTNFITISAPRSRDAVDAFNEFMGGLNKNEYFLFYLQSLETEIVENFTEGKGEDHRGGLKVLKQIRSDIYRATQRKKTDADKTV